VEAAAHAAGYFYRAYTLAEAANSQGINSWTFSGCALSPYLTNVLTPLATAVRNAQMRVMFEKSMPAPRAA
jgi:hypothetical protein